MEQAAIDKCQAVIGYQFTDPVLLSVALTHASVAPSRVQSNERMEFLGDAILSLVVCHDLYRHHDELLEGEMTKIKSVVVSRQTCARIARKLGISELVWLGKGMVGGAGPPMSVSAAVFEAIIGAIYLDGGLGAAREFVLAHVGSHLEDALVDEHHENYKSMLQQYSQRKWNTTPKYPLLDEKGPDHSKCFEIAVTIEGAHFPSAWGMSKKEAEQAAARQALIELGLLEVETEGQAQSGQDD